MGTAASVKEVSGKAEATGVIPCSIKSIFATMQQARADYDVNMKVCAAAVHFAALCALVAYSLAYLSVAMGNMHCEGILLTSQVPEMSQISHSGMPWLSFTLG